MKDCLNEFTIHHSLKRMLITILEISQNLHKTLKCVHEIQEK